jgi:hypothetical protein
VRREIYAAMIFLWLTLPALAVGSECNSGALPPGARRVLQKQFSNWRIVTISDLSADDRDFWSENQGGKCPGLIQGNFVTAHSFAISLIREDQGGLLQTLVLLERSPNRYVLHTLSPASKTTVPNVLLKFPPGKYRDAEQTRSVQTHFDAVAYIKLEAAGTLYYKAPDGFKSLEISE